MNLSELLKKISPLPWSTAPEGITNIIKDANGSCVAMEATDCGDPIAPEDAAYLTHAASTLPQIVEALEAVEKYHSRLRLERTIEEYEAMHEKVMAALMMAKKVRF